MSSTFDNSDMESQLKKRARAGTVTSKRLPPSDLPLPLSKDLDESMSVDFVLTRESILSLIGTTDRIRKHIPWGLDFVETVADNLAQVIDDRLPMQDAVIGRLLLATKADQQAAHGMLMRNFGNGTLVIEEKFEQGAVPLQIWIQLREDKNDAQE
jgi:hypothetical protein